MAKKLQLITPLKGEPGDPGVYVGATEPTDPSVQVWVNPSDSEVTAIPAPDTAKVGQTIVVTEVDEDGKPVEWECANLSTGGIPVSTSAKIGETIVVNAVDADGKPTEWRTINNSGVSVIGEYVVEADIEERTTITLEGLAGNSSSYYVYVSANAKGIPPHFFINGKQVGSKWSTGAWTDVIQIRILRDYTNKQWIVRYRASNSASYVYMLDDESDILESVGYGSTFSANTTIAVCDSFEASIWKYWS